MTTIRFDPKIGFVGGVLRGPPPASCRAGIRDRLDMIYRILRYGCPFMWTEDPCGTCSMRPIKSVDISYGGEPSIEAAISKGLIIPEEVEEFRRQIMGGT